MSAKHVINYRLIFTVLAVMLVCILFIVIFVWKENMKYGILLTVSFIGAEIFGIRQLFLPQRIKSVSVTSAEMIIEYRKATEAVAYEDCKKIEHYKHGPFTERILLHTKGRIIEIPFDLTNFQGMCASIYRALLSKKMEHVADDWFRRKFADKAEALKRSHENETSKIQGTRFEANYPLIWTLMAAQFMLSAALIVLLWSTASLGLKIVGIASLLMFEFFAILVATSPKLTRSVTVSADGMTVRFKEKNFEIPVANCDRVLYSRLWPWAPRVCICADNGFFVLLPWYIRNFHGMCRCIYRVLANAGKESVADKRFRKKYGKVNQRKIKDL